MRLQGRSRSKKSGQPSEKPLDRRLLIVALIVFLDILGFGIIIPVLPFLAESMGAKATQVGMLMMAYSGMQFIFSPVLGRISDRFGRRPVLLLSLAGSAASHLLVGLSHSLTAIALGRALAGIFGASISTAYAYASDVSTESERPRAMGILGAALGLGFTLGPALGALVSGFGERTVFFVGSLLCALNLVWAFRVLAEPTSDRTQRSQRPRLRSSLSEILRRKPQFSATTLYLLLSLSVTMLEATFVLYFYHRLGLGPQPSGLALGLTGIVMALVQAQLMYRLTQRFSLTQIIAAGFFLASIGMFVFGYSSTLVGVGIALALGSLARGVLQPSLSTLASQNLAQSERGGAMGIFQSAASLARVVGPPVAGLTFDIYGPSAPYYLAGVVALLGFILVQIQRPQHDKIVV